MKFLWVYENFYPLGNYFKDFFNISLSVSKRLWIKSLQQKIHKSPEKELISSIINSFKDDRKVSILELNNSTRKWKLLIFFNSTHSFPSLNFAFIHLHIHNLPSYVPHMKNEYFAVTVCDKIITEKREKSDLNEKPECYSMSSIHTLRRMKRKKKAILMYISMNVTLLKL